MFYGLTTSTNATLLTLTFMAKGPTIVKLWMCLMDKSDWMWFNARVAKERFCISSLSQFRRRQPTHLVGIHDLVVANSKAMAYVKHVGQL